MYNFKEAPGKLVSDESLPTKNLMSKWDVRFMQMAELVSAWSKDETPVGAVIVDSKNRIISVGFNGLPAGVSDEKEIYDGSNRVVIHAEMNAMLFAGRDLTGCTIYTAPLPTCAHCAAPIIQSGITRVVGYENTKGKWKHSTEVAEGLYQEANVTFDQYEKEVK